VSAHRLRLTSRSRTTPAHRRRLRRYTRTGISTWLILLAPTAGLASSVDQEVMRIPAEPSCPTCRIELRRVATLDGGAADPGVIAMIPGVTRSTATGRWFASSTEGARQVGVFTPAGRMQSLLGRQGEGPGEYARIWRVQVGRGDSLYVYDRHLSRRTVYSPELDVIRVDPLPAGRYRDVVTLANGRAVISALIQTTESAGYPLHFVSGAGAVERSFGADVAVYPPRDAEALDRTIAVDTGGRIWSAHVADYRIEAFDAGGRKVAEFAGRPDWWRSDVWPDRPTVWGIAFDRVERDILWIRTTVPVPAPPAARRTAQAGSSEVGTRLSQEANDARNDTMLEALDVRTGRIVASRRFPESLLFDHEGFLSHLRIVGDSTVVLDLFEPALIRSTRRLP
jgi:hypothetical protein